MTRCKYEVAEYRTEKREFIGQISENEVACGWFMKIHIDRFRHPSPNVHHIFGCLLVTNVIIR